MKVQPIDWTETPCPNCGEQAIHQCITCEHTSCNSCYAGGYCDCNICCKASEGEVSK